MPDGVMQWFDPSKGVGAVTCRGRSFTAAGSDVESDARRSGARVHFDIDHAGDGDRAVNVVVRLGDRSVGHHARAGSLSGAHAPDSKVTTPLRKSHARSGRSRSSRPVDVVRVWAGSVATGELDGALSLYASSAKVHAGEATFCGRKHLNALLSNCQVEGPAEVAGEDGLVVASWRLAGTGGELTVRSRVEHGLISEQWFGARPESAAGEPQTFQEFPWAVVTRGAVGRDLVDYAWRRLDPVIDTIPDPVRFVKIKLAFAPDPAIDRRARAEASIDVDGDLVRAHVAAGQLEEAVDLLQRRLRDQLSHRSERRLALHKSSGLATPAEWRHGDWAPRPEVFDRPVADRQLVRRKSFAAEEMTPEEAAFDMDQLDHHFYLFRDLASGEDSLLERETDGYRLTRLHPSDLPAHGANVTVDPSIPPTLSVDEAIEALEATHQSLQFFVDTASGRGAVVYRRYDGHNGLITLE